MHRGWMDNVDEILIRVVRGQGTPAERAKVEAWRRESPENEERYREVVAILSLAPRLLEGDGEEWRRPPSAAEVIRRAGGAAGPGRVPRVGLGGRWPTLAGMAAVVLLALVGLPRLADRIGSAPIRTAGAPAAEYRSAPLSGRSFQLGEGILVHLGPDSRLVVHRDGPHLDLGLEGRAFFGMDGRGDRRMTVATPQGNVIVRGTRFEVRAGGDELRLLVVNGQVELAVGDEAVRVEEGEEGEVVGGILSPITRVENPLERLDWMGRALVFQNTPLRQAALEIGRRHDAEVRIEDEALEERTLTALFDGESLGEVMDVVCRAVQARCRLEGRTVIMAR